MGAAPISHPSRNVLLELSHRYGIRAVLGILERGRNLGVMYYIRTVLLTHSKHPQA